MAALSFVVKEGTTKRIQIEGLDAAGNPYDFTNTLVELIAKSVSADATAALNFTLTTDGAGVGVSSPLGRMMFGRPNPIDPDGPLIDATAISGFLLIRFAPGDTIDLVGSADASFMWEARVNSADDTYTIGEGVITVDDSLFDN